MAFLGETGLDVSKHIEKWCPPCSAVPLVLVSELKFHVKIAI